MAADSLPLSSPWGSRQGPKKWNSPRIFLAQRFVACGNRGKSGCGLAGLPEPADAVDFFKTWPPKEQTVTLKTCSVAQASDSPNVTGAGSFVRRVTPVPGVNAVF